MNVLKKALIGTGFGAIVAVMGSSAALAAPLFTVNSSGINGGPTFIADQFNYTSNATIVQTGLNEQTETGYAYFTSFQLNGADLGIVATGLEKPNDYGIPLPGTYGIYLTFVAKVTGLSNFTTGATGQATQFDFKIYADKGKNTAFNTVNCAGQTTCAATTLGGTTGDDILLADGSLIFGQATVGSNGAAQFTSTNFFNVDLASFWAQPNPFYNIVFASTTAASGGSLVVSTDGKSATLNGAQGAANFIPEPLTLSIFGAGLAGAAALRRRKSKKA